MKRILSFVMALAMILSVMIVPALADGDVNVNIDINGDGNTVIVNNGTMNGSNWDAIGIDTARVIYVWNQGEIRATGFLDSNHEHVLVASKDLESIFKEEAGDWMSINDNEYVALEKWAQVFGFSLKLEANNCFLFKDGQGLIELPETIKVFRDDKQVLGVNLHFSDEDQTVFGDKHSLELIFPELKGKLTIQTVEAQTIQYWADKLDYKLAIDGFKVILTSPKPERIYSLKVNNVFTGIKVKGVDDKDLVFSSQEEADKVLEMFGKTSSTSTSKLAYLAAICKASLYVDETKGIAYLFDSSHPPIDVRVNSKEVVFEDVGPMLVNDRTLLPIRAVTEALGCQVYWDSDLRKVTITKSGTIIQLFIDNLVIIVNGVATKLDSPPILHKDRTMLPIRAIAEALGYKVSWEAASPTGGTVIISR